jgi:hypothetical protein
MFVDNFLVQVLERHLLDQLYQLFDSVHWLSLEEVEKIFREKEEQRLERLGLVEKIKRLREARKILS